MFFVKSIGHLWHHIEGCGEDLCQIIYNVGIHMSQIAFVFVKKLHRDPFVHYFYH
jgi:hypothetical protein